MTGERGEGARGLSAATVLWALQFLGGVASAPVYALLAVYVEQALAHTPLYTASLKSIQLALGGLSAPLTGALADRLGYRAAYIWGMTSTVTACAVFLTGQPLLLGGLFLYSGLVGSLQTTAGQAYLIEATRRDRLGLASAGYFLGYTLGTALGSGAAGAFLGAGTLTALSSSHAAAPAAGHGFMVLGILTTLLAAALILGAVMLLPPLRRCSPDHRDSSAQLSTPVMRSDRSRSRVTAPRVPMGQMLQRREVRLLLAIRYLPTCYWGAVTLLIPLLLFRLTGSSEAAGSYAGLSLALAAICQLLTGRFCDRHGVRLPVCLAPVWITVSALGLAVGARSVPALWLFGILGSCAAWSLSTTMPLLIDAASRPDEKGRLVGLTALAWSAGMLTGTLVAGKLASGPIGAARPGLPFALGALCGIGTIGLSLAITREAASMGALPSEMEHGGH